MRQTAKNIFVTVLFSIFLSYFSYCQMIKVDDLVGQYSKATDVQRPQIRDMYKYKTMEVSGIIKDILDWDTFDERTDTAGRYYRVLIIPQRTRDGIFYEVSIFYKDKSKVEPLAKGQDIKVSGTFMKIIDETGSFAVWVYAGELTPEDKMMFQLE